MGNGRERKRGKRKREGEGKKREVTGIKVQQTPARSPLSDVKSISREEQPSFLTRIMNDFTSLLPL